MEENIVSENNMKHRSSVYDSTSGLSYNSQNISFIHMEGDTAHRLDLLFVTLKRSGQIVYG